jgi:YhcH/YjgK/YiaL family protein
MIFDTFENVNRYSNLGQNIIKALTFADNFDPSQPDGKYEIQGDDIFASLAGYQTKGIEELKFEAHRKYIDIQLLLEGTEFIDVSLDKPLKIVKPYDEQSDLEFFNGTEVFSSIVLKPRRFCILFTNEAHRPCRRINDSITVRKMVVKVKA